jgi:hypothetical protein
MATVYMDMLDADGGISYLERDGSPSRLVRRFKVTGLTGETDWQLAEAARSALNSAGYTYNSAPTGEPGLTLTEVQITSVSGSTDTVEGSVTYVAIGQEDNTFRFHVDAGLQQKQTQNDRWGNALVVSHTFPANDDDYPSETRTQLGEPPVLLPQMRLRATGIIRTYNPLFFAADWVGAVNGTWWAGGAPGTWLCTGAPASPVYLDATPPRWRFSFEFQYQPEGWNPLVYFRDAREGGKPPPNLVQGTGIYYADLYRPKDFRTVFP